MISRAAWLTGLTSTVLSVLSIGLLAAPAQAQRVAVTDPSGDQSQSGLDITRVALDNRDYAIRVRATFDEAKAGDLIVSIDRRRGHGLRLVSEYHPHGKTRNYVLGGAFTDKHGSDERITCKGFRARWHADTETAVLRLPSRCFAEDHYGAVRFAVLTERGGGDTDYAPENRKDGDLGTSAWVPRG